MFSYQKLKTAPGHNLGNVGNQHSLQKSIASYEKKYKQERPVYSKPIDHCY